MVLTGGLVSTESSAAQAKENSIHHWVDSEDGRSFKEFVEEEEEESESSLSFEFQFNSFFFPTANPNRHANCRKVQRKLFMLYQSYKIDCCKF